MIFVLSPPATTTRVIHRAAAPHISPTFTRTPACGPTKAAAPFAPTGPTLLRHLVLLLMLMLLILLVQLMLPLLLLAITVMITSITMRHRVIARRHRRRRHPSLLLLLLQLLLLYGLQLRLRLLVVTQRRIPSRRRVLNVSCAIILVRVVQRRRLGSRAGPLVVQVSVLVPILDVRLRARARRRYWRRHGLVIVAVRGAE